MNPQVPETVSFEALRDVALLQLDSSTAHDKTVYLIALIARLNECQGLVTRQQDLMNLDSAAAKFLSREFEDSYAPDESQSWECVST